MVKSSKSRTRQLRLCYLSAISFSGTHRRLFSPSADHFPLLNMWPLGVEEQFYLLWPLGLLVLLKWHPKSTFVIVAAVGLTSLVLVEVLMFIHPISAFYQMPTRFWDLALGGVIALRPVQSLIDGHVPELFGVIIIASSFFFNDRFPRYRCADSSGWIRVADICRTWIHGTRMDW